MTAEADGLHSKRVFCRLQLPETLYGPLLYWIVVCSVAGYYFVTWATQHLPASQVQCALC